MESHISFLAPLHLFPNFLVEVALLLYHFVVAHRFSTVYESLDDVVINLFMWMLSNDTNRYVTAILRNK